MKSPSLSRRTLLRGVGTTGIAIALPHLEAMTGGTAGKAFAATSPPKKTFIFHFGNGLAMRRWTPFSGQSLPPGSPVPLQAGASPFLDLFDQAGLLGDVTVLSGLSKREEHESVVPHSTSSISLLNCQPEGVGGKTVDQWIANKVASRSNKMSSLFINSRDQAGGNLRVCRLSFTGPGLSNAVPPYQNSAALFKKLFFEFSNPALSAEIKNRRLSILDFVRDSVSYVKSRCSSCDRVKLDQHLETIRGIEERTRNYVPGMCSLGTGWQEPVDGVGPFKGIHTADELKVWFDLMIDMATTALQCDLTRVIVFQLTHSGENDVSWPGGYSDHRVSHYMNLETNQDYQYFDEPAVQRYSDSSTWKLQRMIEAIAMLKAKTDVDGSPLLRNTAFVGLSELSDGGLHSMQNLPVVVGGLGMTAGQVIAYPCSLEGSEDRLDSNPRWAAFGNPLNCAGAGYTPLANVWLTLMRAMGVGADVVPKFGNATGTLKHLWPGVPA